jgi:nicotinamide mononucleotide transporter
MLHWILTNYFEIAGFVAALIYLYFSIRQNILLWPWGIITSAIYIHVFYSSQFYADMILNGYYVIISVYGWYRWSGGKITRNTLPVTRASRKMHVVGFIVVVVLTLISGYLLDQYTDSPVPYWDAFTTSASIVATWMLSRKILDNWLYWIVIDAISCGLYFYRGLYPTFVLFLIYTILAVIGYYSWYKTIRDDKAEAL